MTYGIVEILNEHSSIQSLVGLNENGDTYKVYPVVVPSDESPPYLCVRTLPIRPIVCKGEKTYSEIDTVQVDAYAESYIDAYTLYRTVREILDNLSTTLDDGTEVSIQISTARDLNETEMEGLSNRGLFCITSLYDCDVKLAPLT